MPTATVRRRLKRIERFVPRPPAGTLTTVIDASGVNAVRIAVDAARRDRCVLYFHGGAYTIGSAELLQDFTWRIGAAARACVLYFDYRLAPEHPFPAALEDAVTIYRTLVQEFDPRRIAFVGDSAGGGLALATLYKLRDEGLALPAAVVAVSPWTDLALTGPSLKLNAAVDPMLNVAILPALAKAYLGGADPRNHYASPLYGDASGLPPTLIHVGSDRACRMPGTSSRAFCRRAATPSRASAPSCSSGCEHIHSWLLHNHGPCSVVSRRVTKDRAASSPPPLAG